MNAAQKMVALSHKQPPEGIQGTTSPSQHLLYCPHTMHILSRACINAKYISHERQRDEQLRLTPGADIRIYIRCMSAAYVNKEGSIA